MASQESNRSKAPFLATAAYRKVVRGPIPFFIVLFIVVVGIGIAFMLRQSARYRSSAENSLLVITDLKRGQISSWYSERLSDARLVLANGELGDCAIEVVEGTAAPSARTALRAWMSQEVSQGSYARMILYDAHGVGVLSATDVPGIPDVSTDPYFVRALQGNDIVPHDLHRVATGDGISDIRLDFWMPVIPIGAAHAVGAWLLQADPVRFLFPLIQQWPSPSSTAETLLVRREGEQVVFLNALRFNPSAALSLRFPVATYSDLPAAIAVTGGEGIVWGRDYRGVPVLAAVHAVQGTPWSMVSKMDLSEVYAPLRERAWLTGLVFFLAFLVAALGAELVWRRRAQSWALDRLSMDRERQLLAERILLLNRYANDAILLLDDSWRILEGNERARAMYRYSADELCRLTSNDLRADAERFAISNVAPETIRQDGVILEMAHKRKDGSVFPVEVSVRAVDIDATRYFQEIIRDISERKRVEAALLENQERLRLFVEHAPAAIALLDRDMRYMIVSRRWLIDQRLAERDVVGRSHYEIFPEIPERWRAIHRRCLAGAVERCDEDPFPRADGETDYVNWEIHPWRIASGDIGGLCIFAEIVTEAHKAREKLRQSEERLRAFFESDVFGTLFGDIWGGISHANDEFLRIIGYTREDMESGAVRWDSLTPPEWIPDDERAIHEAQARGSCTPYEKQYLSKNGSRVWVLVGFVLTGQKREQSVAFVLDINARKVAEERLGRLNADLEQRVQERTVELKSSMNEIEAFSYSVSHDLRAPLRGIDGWSLALLEDYGAILDEQARGYLTRVRTETQRMGMLIDDLLQLSRVSRSDLSRERVDLSALATTIAGRLRETAPARAVSFDIQPGLTTWADPKLLDIALSNLLDNAFKFTGPGPNPRIEVGRGSEGDFFVRDNGVGFDMAYAEKLFSPFQRMHRASDFPGTGIGLATVYRIVHRHGGRVWAEAAPGKGATFHFVIREPV